MKTINIRGKEYVTVNERLIAFRNQFKDYSLIGHIVEHTPDSVIFEAQIIDDKGIVRANGFARETTQKGGVNKFAMYENAETSAWGRALGNFGIGIDTAVCSADELQSKLEYETEQTPLQKLAKKYRTTESEVAGKIEKKIRKGITMLQEMTDFLPKDRDAALFELLGDAHIAEVDKALLDELEDERRKHLEPLDDEIPDF